MSFQQNIGDLKIRDYVFPVGTEKGGVFTLCGTAFFVGDSGISVTAAHVVDELQRGGEPLSIFTDGTRWYEFRVTNFEKHPTEDVAVIQIDGGPWDSIIEVDGSWEGSSCEYDLWGYPERVAHEPRHTASTPEQAESLVSPDLIYSRGHVRRRISRELPVSVFRGTAFYELSEVGGACCSGAPVIKLPKGKNKPWRAFGVYIGEETSVSHAAVGYATRGDALLNWNPARIGTSLVGLAATRF